MGIDSILNVKDQNDFGFFRMGEDSLLMIDFDIQKSMGKNKNKQNLFTSMTFMETKYLKSHTFKWESCNQFVSLLRIESNRYPSSLMGICRNGTCHILSIDKNQPSHSPKVETFTLGYGSVICATFSTVHKYVTFSCLYHTIVYDLDNHKILYDVERTYFRSLFVISDRSIACGCANGALEIRNYPSLTIQASSQKYEVYHSDNGYRRDLRQELENYDRMLDIDFSISYIDYCSPRNALLTLSPNGELFIWTIDCFPICHIRLDFTPTAACFLNGHGSIVISALRTLYTIDWHYFFNEKLQDEKTLLDDFDILDDKFDLQQFAETRLEHAEELEFLVKQKQTPSHKFKRVLGPDNFESLTPSNSRPPSKMNFRPFRIRRDTSMENEDEHFFDDLTVEQEEIPKSYFYRQEEYLAPKPKRRKIQKPVDNMQFYNLNKNISNRSPRNNNDNDTKSGANASNKNKSQPQKVLKPDKTSEIKVRRKNRRECETEKNNNTSSSGKVNHGSSKATGSNNSKKKKKQSSNQISSLSTSSTKQKPKSSKAIKVKKVTKSSKVSIKSSTNTSIRRGKLQLSSSNLSQVINDKETNKPYDINNLNNQNTGIRLNNTPCQSQNKNRKRKIKKRKENQDDESYEYEDEDENEETNENGNDDKNKNIYQNQNGNINNLQNEATFDFESDEIIIRDPSKPRPNASSLDEITASVSCQTRSESGLNPDFKDENEDFDKMNINNSNQDFDKEVPSLSISDNSKSANQNLNVLNLPNSRPARSIKGCKKRFTSKSLSSHYQQKKIVIEVHMGSLEQGSEAADWRLLSGVKAKSPRNQQNQMKYEVKEPNSQFTKHSRHLYNKNAATNNNNDSTYELVSESGEVFRSPLLYVQNYGESGDEEHFSEPYVIEDLDDPRMKFLNDKKMKYLKVQSME